MQRVSQSLISVQVDPEHTVVCALACVWGRQDEVIPVSSAHSHARFQDLPDPAVLPVS